MAIGPAIAAPNSYYASAFCRTLKVFMRKADIDFADLASTTSFAGDTLLPTFVIATLSLRSIACVLFALLFSSLLVSSLLACSRSRMAALDALAAARGWAGARSVAADVCWDAVRDWVVAQGAGSESWRRWMVMCWECRSRTTLNLDRVQKREQRIYLCQVA